MKPFLSAYNAKLYAVMRIVIGFLFLWHGVQKLFGFPPAAHAAPPAFITYIAGPIELVGGVLIMIGLWTRGAAFLASGLMAFAYWMAHGPKALLPIENAGELAVVYCFVFLFIAAQGPGIWSVHELRARLSPQQKPAGT